MITWVLVIALITSVTWVSEAVIVKEVSAGHLAELPCPSIDDNHRFMYWELSNKNNIIGPGNPQNPEKYNYQVLTGKLMIRGVSTAESGFYKCISRGINDESVISMETVELIVTRDWEDVWENDFETNLLRSLAAVMVIVVIIALLLYVITTKRRRNLKYFDMEPSRENSPVNYRDGTRRSAGVVRNNTPPPEEIGIENAAVDVDFPKVFSKMHQEQAVEIP
ncbi:uncharacterized protein [Neodiprion pinetum]|uniref:uncharacterized protein LOC124185213 n=1 Tax=Neodiprion fabricii TaxID=2872261 RepID=UPI001ED94F89|nr:uncharacterized protein LOC124185213 [Neodiprion fabricii]XP_046488313.1 uncharacterized protein LOC124221921 [Neodiprion pinetum]XP_046625385.1 uncharacterized protein LOC124307591 [Neodiprion virginianus]